MKAISSDDAEHIAAAKRENIKEIFRESDKYENVLDIISNSKYPNLRH